MEIYPTVCNGKSVKRKEKIKRTAKTLYSKNVFINT